MYFVVIWKPSDFSKYQELCKNVSVYVVDSEFF